MAISEAKIFDQSTLGPGTYSDMSLRDAIISLYNPPWELILKRAKEEFRKGTPAVMEQFGEPNARECMWASFVLKVDFAVMMLIERAEAQAKFWATQEKPEEQSDGGK